MKKIAVPCALLLVLVVSVSIAVSGNETETKSTMLSHLKVGQQVKLNRSESDCFNVIIVNEKSDEYKKIVIREEAFRSFKPSTITEIGSDFVVVSNPIGFEQTIAASAIHIVTTFPDDKAPGEADQKK